VELTAHSASFLGCALHFLLWAAAHRGREGSTAERIPRQQGDSRDLAEHWL